MAYIVFGDKLSSRVSVAMYVSAPRSTGNFPVFARYFHWQNLYLQICLQLHVHGGSVTLINKG